jgi:hypothetical protein
MASRIHLTCVLAAYELFSDIPEWIFIYISLDLHCERNKWHGLQMTKNSCIDESKFAKGVGKETYR